MITTSIVFDHRKRVKAGAEGLSKFASQSTANLITLTLACACAKGSGLSIRLLNHPHANELNDRLGVLVGKVMQV